MASSPEPRRVLWAVPYVLFIATNAAVIGPNNRPTGFFFPEIAHPFEALDRAGVAVEFASPRAASPQRTGSTPTTQHRPRSWKPRHTNACPAAAPYPRSTSLDYDAVFFPGGLGPMVDITGNPQVQSVVRRAWDAGLIVSAVCHGPSAFLGVTLDDGTPFVRGRKLTSFSTAEENGYADQDVPFDLEGALREEGAVYEATAPWQPKLVVDGRLVTGQNPQSGTLVGEALVDLLKRLDATDGALSSWSPAGRLPGTSLGPCWRTSPNSDPDRWPSPDASATRLSGVDEPPISARRALPRQRRTRRAPGLVRTTRTRW